MFYVYVLRSKKDQKQIYFGSTVDLKKRLTKHNSGKETSTKRYMPWQLIYYEAYLTEKLARIREMKLKQHGSAKHELKKRVGLHPAPVLKKTGAGYTIIEVLVALAIIGLIFGASYVSFRDFSRRQSLSSVVRNVRGDLRLAQGYATIGKKPEDAKCTGVNVLDSYGFFVNASDEYIIRAYCSGGAVDITTVRLPPDIEASTPSPNPVSFKALAEGTNISTSATITLSQISTGNSVAVTVTEGGEIK